MSEKQSSEYLKRTCLICGCHTNQTINIYEPRSGPNIVKLIQAKFKFQPLNEDKYLCFSCNNWLINWHSLQAVNSNDAESPSGTFRSNQVVGDKAKVAIVKPLAKEATTTADVINSPAMLWNETQDSRTCCSICGKSLRALELGKSLSICHKCREERKLKSINHHQQHQQLGDSMKRQRAVAPVKPLRRLVKSQAKCQPIQKLVTTKALQESLENLERCHTSADTTSTPLHQSHQLPNETFKRPRVDGKLVAMLRRLGTSLARENTPENCSLPVLMSDAPSKAPRWPRPLDDDEILLDFNTAISEVLPSMYATTTPAHHHHSHHDENDENSPEINYKRVTRSHTNNTTGHSNTFQSYRMSSVAAHQLPQDICSMLPKGLSIAVVSH